jgi:hypothetical protein
MTVGSSSTIQTDRSRGRDTWENRNSKQWWMNQCQLITIKTRERERETRNARMKWASKRLLLRLHILRRLWFLPPFFLWAHLFNGKVWRATFFFVRISTTSFMHSAILFLLSFSLAHALSLSLSLLLSRARSLYANTQQMTLLYGHFTVYSLLRSSSLCAKYCVCMRVWFSLLPGSNCW